MAMTLNFLKFKFTYNCAKISLILAIPLIVLSIIHAIYAITAIDNERKIHPRQQVQTAFGILEHFHKLELNGTLTTVQAQTNAKELIRKLRYNESDYFWLNNVYGILVMHPYRPELEGKSLLGLRDSNGVKIFAETIRITSSTKEGWFKYSWPRPNSSEEAPKISFVRAFEPWGWIIGTGVYSSDSFAIAKVVILDNLFFMFLSYLLSVIIILNTINKLHKVKG